jgi:autotransporter-associated beta strand protein
VQANGSTVGSLAGAGTLNSNAGGVPVRVGGDNTSTTFSGTLGSSGPFEKVGAGTQTLTGALSLGGTVTVDGGTLRIGDGVTGPFSVSPSAFIVNAALEFDSPLGVTMNAGTSGTGSLTVGGAGLQALGPDLTHQGATTVNAGSLIGRIFNNAPLTIAAGAMVQANGSTVGSLAGAGTLNSNAGGVPVRVGGDNTSTTFSGNLGSSGPFEKVGAGTLTLSGTSTNGGTKSVLGGSLLVTGSIPGTFIVDAGATLGGTGTISGPVTINAGGTLAPGLSPGITNTGDLNLGGVLLVEIEGTTVGTQYDQTNVTGTVTIAGGTLTLAGAYAPLSGNTFVIVANDGADAVTGTFTGLPEGATIAFNGATLQVSYVGGTGNDITLTALAPTSTVWNGAGANDNWGTGLNWIGGASPASGNATVVTFPTASARFGPLVDAPWTVNRMDITGTTAYAMTGQAVTFAGATPQLNTSGAAHSLANPLTLSAALAVNNASALTLSGAIDGAPGITKTGAGVLSLTGTSTFAGGTTVNGGTLFVNGTIPGPVAVNAGATLGGTGTITGTVAINAGGTLAPGLSPGLTNTGDLNLAGAFLVEIEGTTVGTQYDQTNVTGTVTIAGGTLTLAGAYVPVAGNVFTVIANDGADAVTGTFAGLAEGATITFNGVTLVISYIGGTGNDVVLTAQAAAVAAPIPTLSQWGVILLAMLLAAAGMTAARRR